MGRSGRRRRGIRVERYQIELELGRVEYALRHQDTSGSAADNHSPDDTSTRGAN